MDDCAEGWGAPCSPTPDEPVPIRLGTKHFITVMGYRFGAWSVHRARPIDGVMTAVDPDAWAVSHVPTGMALGSWVAELTFWDAVRVATALHDSGLYPDAVIDTGNVDDNVDGTCLIMAVIGAALQDHYVFPIVEAQHG